MFYRILNFLLIIFLFMAMVLVTASITNSKEESATSSKSTEAAMADPKAELAKAIEKGKAIFNDTKLGNSGMSCNSCHPDGGTVGGKMMGMDIPTLKGAAATFPKYKGMPKAVITLQQMNNMCIKMIMKGEPQKFDSPESIALAAYVTSLSNGIPVKVGEK